MLRVSVALLTSLTVDGFVFMSGNSSDVVLSLNGYFWLSIILFHRTSGVTDYYAVDDFHALHQARQCVKNLNLKKTLPVSTLYSAITIQEIQ